MEIRLHGRGGQGGVTCAKILASAYARLGKSVQTFGDYASERSGAPIRAYTRVSDGEITNRNKVYHPDHLLVLHPSLLGADVIQRLANGGMLVVNSPTAISHEGSIFAPFHLATVDATAIARRHGIGTRSVVIVNTTIAGAYAKLLEMDLKLLEQVYLDLGFSSNFAAAKEAYEQVKLSPAIVDSIDSAPSKSQKRVVSPSTLEEPGVRPLVEHTDGAHTGLKTGTWRTQTPVYVQNLAPCNAWCPAGNDAIEFVQVAGRDGAEAAAQILGATTPFAGTCGRVCPAPCMEGCNRVELDGAVNIRGLERWIADRAPVAMVHKKHQDHPKRIAIVGGGPAGLSAAYFLASQGHRPEIYEGEAELGGVLRTGIPTYRLPREVLDQEIQGILNLGVKVHCGEFFSKAKLQELVQNFDGVILSTGLQWLRPLVIPGSDLTGIEQGIHYLHKLNMGQTADAQLSGTVVVLGGGNTAMDCARSALRNGAEKVIVAYRRTEQEMPAIREEIHAAHEEGIEFHFLRQPVGFFGESGVSGIQLAECDLGEPDESGRRRPVVSERVQKLECNHVLLALGQGSELSIFPTGWELNEERIHDGSIPINAWGSGDFATGDGTVTHAIGSGRRVAGLVLKELGEDVEVFERPPRENAVPASVVRMDHFDRSEPSFDRSIAVAERFETSPEVNQGLADASEADRCFSCGHCTNCDTCLVFCPEGIIRRQPEGTGLETCPVHQQADYGYSYDIDLTYCKGCGICVTECPRGAIEMKAR
ncbi:MAG: 2-oxoacid:acceptor oxidoreductase family protein [Planctomycetes bacterium]|nr:2-oxoacid:acceptor oxidoreductase family protein [Planctomycetota bacterium]